MLQINNLQGTVADKPFLWIALAALPLLTLGLFAFLATTFVGH